MNPSGYLELRNLSLDLDDFKINNLELEIKKGEYFVLLGPTGAGKTVLLESIAGITPPASGTILLDGGDITHIPPEHRKIGFVYQDFALFPHLSVEKNISFGLINSIDTPDKRSSNHREDSRFSPARLAFWRENKIKQNIIASKIQEISNLLGVSDLLDRKTDSLSGGEKQRVALARALVISPRILLLDEPLSALDPEIRENIQFELRRIHQELGTTTLHITHNFEVAVALADRIGVIIGGEIMQIGTPREIFRQPNNEQVARYVVVRNIFHGQHIVEEDGCGNLQLDGFVFTSISDQEGIVRASIRPEDILLSRDSLISSARNNFKGKVVEISDRGPFSYITVRIPSSERDVKNLDLVVLITRSSAEELALDLGQEIFAAFKASALHIF